MEKKVSIEQVCVLAGKIMLQSGAETYRVEDTMNRIATAFGVKNPQSYATPTGINFAVDVAEETYFLRITTRSTDLHKVAEVNTISRSITAGELNLREAFSSLIEVDNDGLLYHAWIRIIVAAFVSGCFTIMFGGVWNDFIPALVAGGFGYAGMLGVDRLLEIRFVSEFLGAVIIGFITVICIYTGIGKEMDKIIIGGVMPLVPGLLITNAVRDLISGHLVSGLSKGIEASITAFAIGAGIAAIIAFA
ncbi:threonine/serine exporter family protein [Oceanobacillus chungangensis]|uniref:Threonine/serine exporter-like N-terminal domain-containing protein n=1 Tax=Oceanobacillus chungangensis TaxID=1229152 RepID=A0A3D8PZ34_9BACI|nr:threonine/serine exporter family protein [Oceanobacillus chungangensis]RDW20578.1 hypothetical protein CWR45_04905 [Oceanobacillus chungangensis]